MSYKDGEVVLCKREDKEIPGTIINFTQKYVEVKLQGGEVVKLLPRDVSSLPSPKRRARSKSRGSPARERKSSPSRGRRSSPARGRKSSPSRKQAGKKSSPSPARKSPARPKPSPDFKPRLTRSVAALIEKPIENKETNNRLSKLSDDEEEDFVIKGSQTKKYSLPVLKPSFLHIAIRYIFSTCLIVAIPLIVLFLYISCTKRGHCTLRSLPSFPRDLASYISSEATIIYAAWITLQAALTLIPLGPKVKSLHEDPALQITYRLNGFHQLTFNVAIIAGLIYYKIPFYTYITKHLLPLIVLSHIFALVLSSFLYWKSTKAPLEALNPKVLSSPTKTWLSSFLLGREINPRLLAGHLDVKHFLLKLAIIGLVVLNASLCIADYDRKGCINPGLLFTSGIQALLALDVLYREDVVIGTTSALLRYDGCGHLLVVYLIGVFPFLHHLSVQHWYYHQGGLPLPLLSSAIVLGLVGFALHFKSTQARHASRRHPTDISGDVVKTSGSKFHQDHPLILSGLWGVVRHPNYLGFLLIVFSGTLILGVDQILLLVPFFITIILVIWRCLKLEADLEDRHGTAWAKYCDRVPYRLLPKIF